MTVCGDLASPWFHTLVGSHPRKDEKWDSSIEARVHGQKEDTVNEKKEGKNTALCISMPV